MSKVITRPLSTKDIERFWAKVDKTGACWLWMSAVGDDGYGLFQVGSTVLNEHRTLRAHRLAWEIANGRPLPARMQALHSCPGGDNRLCVNPAHLRAGTHRENMRDMARRGRAAHGEAHPRATLTEEKVREIRRRHAAGELQQSIADDLRIRQCTVSAIARRLSWKHVA